MTPLLLLAEKVEGLEGGCRETDLAIHNTLGVEYRWSWVHSQFKGPKDLAVEVEPEWYATAIAEGAGAMDVLWQPDVRVIPRYTASQDAAMSLVPGRYVRDVMLNISPMSVDMGGKDYKAAIGGYKNRSSARSFALALVAAALRARAAMEAGE